MYMIVYDEVKTFFKWVVGLGDKKCVDFFLLKIKILLPFIVINIVSDNDTAKRLSLFKCQWR